MPATLFDIDRVASNRTRAAHAEKPALFLHERAALQIQERLNEVNRRFTKVAIITAFPDLWKKYFPSATIVEESERLRFSNAPYDLVIHAFFMHWSNDPVGQMIQCCRALLPDGLFMGVLFGGNTLNELRSSLAEAETNLTGGLRPRISPMAEIRDLGGLLMRAGFALPVADNDLIDVSYPSLNALMHDLRAMGETNALSGRKKTLTTRRLFKQAAEIYATHFGTDNTRLKASFDMIYLTGWAPSATQQKPLKPGSATTRLADALGQFATTPKTETP